MGPGFSSISKMGLKPRWKKAHGQSILCHSPSALPGVRALWLWSTGKQQPQRQTLQKGQVAFLLGGGGAKEEAGSPNPHSHTSISPSASWGWLGSSPGRAVCGEDGRRVAQTFSWSIGREGLLSAGSSRRFPLQARAHPGLSAFCCPVLPCLLSSFTYPSKHWPLDVMLEGLSLKSASGSSWALGAGAAGSRIRPLRWSP